MSRMFCTNLSKRIRCRLSDAMDGSGERTTGLGFEISLMLASLRSRLSRVTTDQLAQIVFAVGEELAVNLQAHGVRPEPSESVFALQLAALLEELGKEDPEDEDVNCPA